MPIGGSALDLTGVPLPEETLSAAKKSDAILLGAIGGYKWDTNPKHLKPETGLLRLSAGLEVFANKACNCFATAGSCFNVEEVAEGVDIMVVRELTGGSLSAALLLRYSLQESEAAERIENAVLNTLDKGCRTGDIFSAGHIYRQRAIYYPHKHLCFSFSFFFWASSSSCGVEIDEGRIRQRGGCQYRRWTQQRDSSGGRERRSARSGKQLPERTAGVEATQDALVVTSCYGRSQSCPHRVSQLRMAFLIGLLTGLIATLINLAVKNVSGYKLLLVSNCIQSERYVEGFVYLVGANFMLTLTATVLCVCFALMCSRAGDDQSLPQRYRLSQHVRSSHADCQDYRKHRSGICGADLGKEGPLVHIGACIASLLAQGATKSTWLKWRWLRYLNNGRDTYYTFIYMQIMHAIAGIISCHSCPNDLILFSFHLCCNWQKREL